MAETPEAPQAKSPSSSPKSQQSPRDQQSPEAQLLIAEEAEAQMDDDSAIGDDNASSTASLRSSIMQYRQENGRTYHSFKEHIGYVLPNDDTEQERLDLQHHLFNLTFHGKLFVSPAGEDKQITRCLDVGTGTGIWAMDFATEHPEVKVIGIDISPIQPSFVPPNLEFQVDDLEDEWTFAYKFDFVFARMMVGSFSDWPKFFKQSFNNLNPGGWVECQDICFPGKCDDDTVKEDSFIMQWCRAMMEASGKLGRSAESANLYKQQMIEAGFVNVTEVVYKWPTNKWPADPHFKTLGFWSYQNIGAGLSGLSMALFTRMLGWTQEEVEVFLSKVRNDLKNPSIHAYWPIHVVYGQKPEESE